MYFQDYFVKRMFIFMYENTSIIFDLILLKILTNASILHVGRMFLVSM